MYKGDISIEDMLVRIANTPQNCVLVDVRTAAEWQHTGIADVACDVHPITVVSVPDRALMPDYTPTLINTVAADKTVYFMCRSGVRSQLAAAIATQNHIPESYNVLEGMQGWLARALPTKSISQESTP